MNPHKTVLSSIAWPSVDYALNPLDKNVTAFDNVAIMGQLFVAGALTGNSLPLPPGRVFWLDDTNGNDNYDGKTPLTAFKTPQAAINAMRGGTASDIDYTDKSQLSVCFVMPGHYNLTTYISISGYNMWFIGLGTPGGDWGVTINYTRAFDGAPSTIVYSGSGIVISNIFVKGAGAYPGIWCAGGDNNYVINCMVEGDTSNSTYGIQMTNLESSLVANNTIWNVKTAGIYVPGGADQYMINSKIIGNLIRVATTGGKGIYVHSNTTAYNSLIAHNDIDVEAAGATGKGIDIDATGNVIVRENAVIAESGATAIEHAGHGLLHNWVSVNGTVTDPFDDD